MVLSIMLTGFHIHIYDKLRW